MKQDPNKSLDVCRFRRRRRFLLLGITACLSGGCATMWYQTDPQYTALQSEIRSGWKPNDIVGVWVAQSSARPGLPAMRVTMVIKPDGTAQQRQSGVSGGTATWSYDGRRTWTITPDNNGKALDRSMGMYWLPLTVRYTGRYLLVDAPWNGGAYSAGAVVKNSHVFVRPDDEEAVREILQKKF